MFIIQIGALRPQCTHRSSIERDLAELRASRHGFDGIPYERDKSEFYSFPFFSFTFCTSSKISSAFSPIMHKVTEPSPPFMPPAPIGKTPYEVVDENRHLNFKLLRYVKGKDNKRILQLFHM